MQRTTTTTARHGQEQTKPGADAIVAPSFPLLRMTLIAMMNLAVVYSTLTWIPTWLNNYTSFQDHQNQQESAINNNIPLPSLSWTLVTLFGLQTAIGLIQWSLYSSSQSPNTKSKKNKGVGSSSIFSTLNTSIAIGTVGTLIYHLFAVLFGAGIISQSKETNQLAGYLSLLTFYPASFVLGTDLKSWIRIFVHNNPRTYTEAAFYCQGMMAVFGAWLGSIVIPLDWDRPWQAWPVPCVLGAFLFYCIGTVVGLVLSIMMRQRAARSEFGIEPGTNARTERQKTKAE